MRISFSGRSTPPLTPIEIKMQIKALEDFKPTSKWF